MLGKILRRSKIRFKVAQLFEEHPDVLHYLLEEFGAFSPPYVRGAEGADRESTYQMGRQSCAHDLLNIVNMSPQEILALRRSELDQNQQDQQEYLHDD